MARTKKDVKAHRKTKPHPAPKKDLSLVLKHFPTQYVKRPRNKRMVGTAEEKKRARAKVQQGYVKDLGVAIKVLQGKIPIVKDIQRRVSIHKVLRAAIHYIKHLQLTLEDKPTTNFEDDVQEILMRRSEMDSSKKVKEESKSDD